MRSSSGPASRPPPGLRGRGLQRATRQQPPNCALNQTRNGPAVRVNRGTHRSVLCFRVAGWLALRCASVLVPALVADRAARGAVVAAVAGHLSTRYAQRSAACHTDISSRKLRSSGASMSSIVPCPLSAHHRSNATSRNVPSSNGSARKSISRSGPPSECAFHRRGRGFGRSLHRLAALVAEHHVGGGCGRTTSCGSRWLGPAHEASHRSPTGRSTDFGRHVGGHSMLPSGLSLVTLCVGRLAVGLGAQQSLPHRRFQRSAGRLALPQASHLGAVHKRAPVAAGSATVRTFRTASGAADALVLHLGPLVPRQ